MHTQVDGTVSRPSRAFPGARLRVAYLLDHVGIGGTAVHLLQVLRRLDRSRFKPLVCCLDGEASRVYDPEGYRHMQDRFREAGAVFRALHMPSVYRPGSLGQYPLLVRVLREHGTHILHANLFDSTVAGVLAAVCARVPVRIASRRESAAWMRRRHHWAMRLTNRLCQAVIVNSREIARQCREWQGLSAHKLHLVYNGIDYHDLRARLARHPPRPLAAPGCPVIGMVANLVPLKGHAYLLSAFAMVLRDMPRARLVLVGDGPLRRELAARAENLGIAGKVIFAGRAPCEQWLPSFTHAVLSSVSEGGSNAVLEYMAAGLPMVVTAVGAHPEILEHRRTACLAPPADVGALAAELGWLLRHPQQARVMGAAARAELESRYTAAAMADKMMALYRQLATSAGIAFT